MILNQRKKSGQISVQLCLQDENKLCYATYLEYLKRLGYFENITSSAYQQCMLNFLKRMKKTLPGLCVPKSKTSNFKLLVPPI